MLKVNAITIYMTSVKQHILELAAHAESIKIDGIAVLAPMYYKCADIDSLVEYLAGKLN